MRPGVRNIAVHTRDVLRVRVGRFQAAPPVTRVVIDLNGPRAFEVEPSANQVVVRVKTEAAAAPSAPVQAAPAPAPAPAVVPATWSGPPPPTPWVAETGATNAAMAAATPVKGSLHARGWQYVRSPALRPCMAASPVPSSTPVASILPAPSSAAPSPAQPASVPSMAAGMAADVTAPASPAARLRSRWPA